MTYFMQKIAALKGNLGSWNLICLILMICGGLLLMPGTVILAYVNTKWIVHGIVIGVVMIALGCEFMRSSPATAPE